MRSLKFTIILLAIIFLGSCGEETPAETTVQEAEIIEQMELPELDDGSQMFHSVYKLDVSSGEMLWNPVLKIGAGIFEKYQNRMDFNAKEGRAYYVIGKTLYQVRM